MHRMLVDLRETAARSVVGPDDHGRSMSLWEFRSARETPGWVYELIDGALVVSPNPVPQHDYWVNTVRDALSEYAKAHPKQINWVSERSEIEVPNRTGPTRPQPDVAAFRDFPHPPPHSWDDVCPLIVVEVISERRSEKDTIRNRHLYWEAKGIREYWIVDTITTVFQPALIVLVRRPRRATWDERRIAFGRPYRCRLLPGFAVNLDRNR